jgi:hypothetical protein
MIDAGKLFILNYLGRIVWKLSLQGSFFCITNYQGFQNNQVNVYEFFSLGLKLKLRFELSWNFKLTRFYYITEFPV